MPDRDPATRVVVTGIGCVSPLGMSVDETWDAAANGRSGAAAIRAFDTEGFPSTIAAEVKGELDLGDVPEREVRRMDRVVQLAMAAAREALEASALEVNDGNRDRVGVSVGSGIGGLETLTANQTVLDARGPRRVSPFMIPMSIANMPSGLISLQYGLRGPNLCHVSACATGAHSIGESMHVLRRGDADVMLAGGTEAPIQPLGLAGFAAMKALTTRNDEPERASRPFDRDRDGFLIGEGATVLVLETLAHARARGARPLVEVAGYAATADASHMVAPDPEGAGAARCMQLALQSAGLAPEAVEHVNCHATSTPAGDPTEVAALQRVFGAHTRQIAVSATKSMTGHLLGAAGALEAMFCIKAIETGLLPPTINLENVDEGCELDHVTGKARAQQVATALSNSFGFGGTNAALVFRHLDA
jgi:3-oxoacyl-[acyl-carrier-protein] synthase II